MLTNQQVNKLVLETKPNGKRRKSRPVAIEAIIFDKLKPNGTSYNLSDIASADEFEGIPVNVDGEWQNRKVTIVLPSDSEVVFIDNLQYKADYII